MHSCVYEGRVRHRRFAPFPHAFEYRLFMMYLDLDELPTLFRGRWFWGFERRRPASFRRRDYFGDPQQPLAETVRDLVARETGRRPEGPVRLLTHLRYYGYCFNPISVYFCFDPAGEQVEAVVAEVTNTPWRERHCYVLSPGLNGLDAGGRAFAFTKAFHVSPFMGMEAEYLWRFSGPGRRLMVHMDSLTPAEGGQPGVDGTENPKKKLFDATLTLTRREITAYNLARSLFRYPWMTAQVWGAIHWQALRLWWKRAPYFPHPKMPAPQSSDAPAT